MGIFSSIKDAIFGHHDAAAAALAPVSAAAAEAAPAAAATPAPAPAPTEPVDVEAILDKIADDKGVESNWRVSIVDLMTLLGLDASLAHRKELAEELHYDGDMDDSASMNIWLHKHVMTELAANGGKVPADMTA